MEQSRSNTNTSMGHSPSESVAVSRKADSCAVSRKADSCCAGNCPAALLTKSSANSAALPAPAMVEPGRSLTNTKEHRVSRRVRQSSGGVWVLPSPSSPANNIKHHGMQRSRAIGALQGLHIPMLAAHLVDDITGGVHKRGLISTGINTGMLDRTVYTIGGENEPFLPKKVARGGSTSQWLFKSKELLKPHLSSGIGNIERL